MAYNLPLGVVAAGVAVAARAPRLILPRPDRPTSRTPMPTPTYAIVRTGGKQYRVHSGQTLLVEKLAVEVGQRVALEPLLYRGDDDVVLDAEGLGRVSVSATVVGHERGPKIRVFKYKPKRGYKRRAGHRQSLTRLEIGDIALKGGSGRARDGGRAATAPATSAPAMGEPGARGEPAAAPESTTTTEEA